MNELQVIYEQTPGVIHWNFEELKAAVAEQMRLYEGLVYDDDNIKTAKKDVASLRKLKKAVEDKRIEIKKSFMEPYTQVEDQTKELTSLIDKPIAAIDKQVKEYETAQKEKRKAEIIAYMQEAFSDFAPVIQKRLMCKCYNCKWENSTAKTSEWKAAVDAAAKATQADLNIIDSVEEDLWEPTYTAYLQGLVLSDALNKVAELRKQKEMILEQERRRREAEQVRKAQEEARRAEAQRRQQEAVVQPTAAQEPQQTDTAVIRQRISRTEAPRQSNPETGRTIVIKATDKQYKKILAYITYVGAEYREV